MKVKREKIVKIEAVNLHGRTLSEESKEHMTRKKLFSSLICALMMASVASLASLSAAAASGQDAAYRISDKEVQKVMKQLKKDTEKFRKSLDSSLDRSRIDGTNREDNINDFLEEYEKATERLYEHFKDNKSVGADVEAVLDGAARIDQFMTRHSPTGRAERDWAAVRQDLRRLAEAYNVTWRWWSVG
jgi:CHASE3 domain sensor protein